MKLALEAAVLAAVIGLGAVEIAHTADPASATQAANPSVAAPDIKFMELAARYANADIQLAQIAQTQANIPEVKAFAQQIITLQQAHLQALDKLAKKTRALCCPANRMRRH